MVGVLDSSRPANLKDGPVMTYAIRCEKLFKRYDGKPPVEAVRGLDLHVEVGDCFGLLGPNGAGKTTTIEILEGLLQPTSGEVEILGMWWQKQDRAIRERIGISLQETKLSEKLTVQEVLTLFRSFYSKGREPEDVMQLVSLTEKAHAQTKKLSGGQKQRLALGCALVGDPDLLFLDEPTTGLDPQARRQVWDIVHLYRQMGRTVLITTHYMDEAERLCNRIAIVDKGKVIALGSPRELIASIGGEHIIEFTVREKDGVATLEENMLKELPAVQTVRRQADHWSLTVQEPHIALPALLERLGQTGHEMTSLTTRHASLEDVFVALTGRHLREEGENQAA
jgi:ABC-2 type transport system ATP-binding protein